MVQVIISSPQIICRRSMELSCAHQTYAWGKVGLASAVASLLKDGDPTFQPDPEKPYSELWMGTHPNGPSKIASTQLSLKEFVQANPDMLGAKSVELFSNDLPFLFKVLSVNKALSIQAHPNKEHAQQLHNQRPDVYKDPNHKPEMAIALTEFEGLCGFRPLQEIKEFVEKYPQLRNVIGHERAKSLLQAADTSYERPLQEAFTSLMTASKETLQENLASFKSAITCRTEDTLEDIERLFLRLLEQYPGDVGCFVIFFVNYLKLQPGEAMFLAPNLIHAYLFGDCMECMACSDNVVRAGLTPKLIDVPTLCSMLEYRYSSPELIT